MSIFYIIGVVVVVLFFLGLSRVSLIARHGREPRHDAATARIKEFFTGK